MRLTGVLRALRSVLVRPLPRLVLPFVHHRLRDFAGVLEDLLVHVVHAGVDALLGRCQEARPVFLALFVVDGALGGGELVHLRADAPGLLFVVRVVEGHGFARGAFAPSAAHGEAGLAAGLAWVAVVFAVFAWFHVLVDFCQSFLG